MKECFKIEIYNRHILILFNEGKKLLFDTGSPQTIFEKSEIEIAGLKHDNIYQKIYGKYSINDIGDLLTTKINGLVGCDILNEYIVKIQPKDKRICFYTEVSEIEDMSSAGNFTKVLGGVSKLEVEVEGKSYNILLDSGAKTSYIDKSISNGLESLGLEDDFHPFTGHFKTETFSMKTKLLNWERDVIYGNLPETFQIQINKIGANGVLGSDLFVNADIIIDFINNKIKIN